MHLVGTDSTGITNVHPSYSPEVPDPVRGWKSPWQVDSPGSMQEHNLGPEGPMIQHADENGISLWHHASLTFSSAPVGTESSLTDWRGEKNKSKSQNVTDTKADSLRVQLQDDAYVCLVPERTRRSLHKCKRYSKIIYVMFLKNATKGKRTARCNQERDCYRKHQP